MNAPVGGVAAIVKIGGEPTVGFAEAEMDTGGRGCGVRVTDDVSLTESPNESTPVTTTTNEPSFRYVCDMADGWPLNVCGDEPSPQSTVIREMGVEFVVLNVN